MVDGDARPGTRWELASYRVGDSVRAGLVVARCLYDVGSLPSLERFATALELLAEWSVAAPRLAAIANAGVGGGVPLAEVELLAPVPEPPTVYGAGANYHDHVAEMMAARGLPPPADPRERGGTPWHFLKASRCVTGPGAVVALPRGAEQVDWEIELAAVIGRRAKDVTVADALSHVAGYTVANDLSARDLGRRTTVPETSLFHADWIGQKSFDGSCPLGPVLAPAAFVPDPMHLAMRLWVNGTLKQDSNTRAMIFSVAEQIAFLSSRLTLHPGDVILTGTPAGVGAGRGEYLKSGDELELWIEQVGTLRHRVA